MVRWVLPIVLLFACARAPINASPEPAKVAFRGAWLHETIRVRRADEPGNGCWRVAGLRRRFFEKRPEAAACSRLFESPSEGSGSWVLHYRLVRRPRPILQFERSEGLDEARQACVSKGGALERLPIPSELAVLSVDRRDLEKLVLTPSVAAGETEAPGFDALQGVPPVLQRGSKIPASCRRLELNLKQDEIMEAKLRLPLMVVSVAQAASAGEGHWIDRLWLAPFLDRRGIDEGWLQDSVLPATACSLCLKKAYTEAITPARARQLETR